MKIFIISLFVISFCLTSNVDSSFLDSLPLVSQLKSAVQAIAGDTEGARRTQENFSRGCPVVSQIRSAVEAIGGDEQAARNTQKYFAQGLSELADGLPVVGHVKGGIHYAVGDKEGGDQAMKSASRTVGVIAGGAIGTLVGGPMGGVAGGIAGGAVVDSITTGVESAIYGEYRPNGLIASTTRVINGKSDVGEIFDTVAGVALDGVTSLGLGKAKAKLSSITKRTQKQIKYVETIKQKLKIEDSTKHTNIDYIENILDNAASETVEVRLAMVFELDKNSPSTSASSTHWLSWEDNVLKDFFTHMDTPLVSDGIHIHLHSRDLGIHHILYGKEGSSQGGHLSQFSNIGVTGPKELFNFFQSVMEPTKNNFMGKFHKKNQTPGQHDIHVYRIPDFETNYLAVGLSKSRRYAQMGTDVHEVITAYLPSTKIFDKTYVKIVD